MSKKYLFITLILMLCLIIGTTSFYRFDKNLQLPAYSQDTVLAETAYEKNKPLVKELYRLGNRVGDLKQSKSKNIINNNQREAHILLSKICKDSCLPIRCRLDQGLGHACRVNCPSHKIRFCITTLRPLRQSQPS